jgi:hypothetical protein
LLGVGRKRARSSDDGDDKKPNKKSKKNTDPQVEGPLTTDLTMLEPEEKLYEIPLAEFRKYLIEDVAQLCMEYLGLYFVFGQINMRASP